MYPASLKMYVLHFFIYILNIDKNLWLFFRNFISKSFTSFEKADCSADQKLSFLFLFWCSSSTETVQAALFDFGTPWSPYFPFQVHPDDGNHL